MASGFAVRLDTDCCGLGKKGLVSLPRDKYQYIICLNISVTSRVILDFL